MFIHQMNFLSKTWHVLLHGQLMIQVMSPTVKVGDYCSTRAMATTTIFDKTLWVLVHGQKVDGYHFTPRLNV